jgi:hypothetical protein
MLETSTAILHHIVDFFCYNAYDRRSRTSANYIEYAYDVSQSWGRPRRHYTAGQVAAVQSDADEHCAIPLTAPARALPLRVYMVVGAAVGARALCSAVAAAVHARGAQKASRRGWSCARHPPKRRLVQVRFTHGR